MTRFMFFVLTFGCIMHSLSAAHDAEFYSTVAKEAFDTGLYQMALDKCNEAVKKQPDNKGCIKIIADSTEQLNKQNIAEKKAEEKKRKEEAIEEKKAKAKEDTEGAIYIICQDINAIKLNRQNLARERETAIRSGVTNLTLKYEANNNIIALEQQIAEQKAIYRKATGKSFSQSLCKDY